MSQLVQVKENLFLHIADSQLDPTAGTEPPTRLQPADSWHHISAGSDQPRFQQLVPRIHCPPQLVPNIPFASSWYQITPSQLVPSSLPSNSWRQESTTLRSWQREIADSQLDLNISQRTLSMGVLPTVLLKKISWTAEAETWPRAGRRRRSLPARTRPPAPHTLLARYWGGNEVKRISFFLTGICVVAIFR